MKLFSYLMLSTAHCANREMYAVSRCISLFTVVLKRSSALGYFVPALECLEYTCDATRGPEESLRLHLTTVERLECQSLDESALSKGQFIERLDIISMLHYLHYISWLISTQALIISSAWLLILLLTRESRIWKYFNVSKNVKTKRYFQLLHRDSVYYAKFSQCERYLRSIRHRLRLVGGQGKERKDERMRPGEVVRRCCGSCGSKVAEITARTWLVAGPIKSERACAIVMRFSSESVSDKYLIFTLLLFARVHIIPVRLNFLTPSSLESRKRDSNVTDGWRRKVEKCAEIIITGNFTITMVIKMVDR